MTTFNFDLIIARAGTHEGETIPVTGIKASGFDSARNFATAMASAHQKSIGGRSARVVFTNLTNNTTPTGLVSEADTEETVNAS